MFVESFSVGGRFVEVDIKNRCAVENHGNLSPLATDFLMIPLTDRLEESSLGGSNAIGRTMELIRLELGIFLCAVIENLQLNTNVSDISL